VAWSMVEWHPSLFTIKSRVNMCSAVGIGSADLEGALVTYLFADCNAWKGRLRMPTVTCSRPSLTMKAGVREGVVVMSCIPRVVFAETTVRDQLSRVVGSCCGDDPGGEESSIEDERGSERVVSRFGLASSKLPFRIYKAGRRTIWFASRGKAG
jgi:hypothetical protein